MTTHRTDNTEAPGAIHDPLARMVLGLERREARAELRTTITLVPDKWGGKGGRRISANDRLHPLAKNKLTGYWRGLAAWHGLEAQGLTDAEQAGASPLFPSGRVVVVFRFPNRAQIKEVANLQPTVKAIVDGLVDARIFPGDEDGIVWGQDARRDPEFGPYRALVLVYGDPA